MRGKHTLKKNIFELYLAKLTELPLWVKQVLYIKLKEDMEKNCCAEFLDTSSSDMFSLHVPILTFNGKNELLERKNGLDTNIYNFLNLCEKGYSIIEISLNMFLTMEEAAKYFMFCIEQKYLEMPESAEAYAMAGFISGKLKTGEYLRKNKTLTIQQVQEALDEQKKIDDCNGKHLKFVEVLDTMDMVKEDDFKVIFLLKEEAKKRFILDYNIVPDTARTFQNAGEKTSAEIEELKKENKKLKEKLIQLLKLVKRNV